MAAIAAGAAIITATGAYLSLRRKKSGQIDTSEAAELWAEAKAMREDYHARVNELKQDVADAQEEVRQIREEYKLQINIMKEDVATARADGALLKVEAQRLRTEHDRLLFTSDNCEKKTALMELEIADLKKTLATPKANGG